MISDPKLPFSGNPTGVAGVGERTDPAKPPSPPAPIPLSLARPPAPSSSAARLWLRRVGVLLFVFFCATLGVMLMILPWRPEWSDNPLLIPYPAFRSFIATGFVRGLATGLGFVNVWIGFWEAVQYREE